MVRFPGIFLHMGEAGSFGLVVERQREGKAFWHLILIDVLDFPSFLEWNWISKVEEMDGLIFYEDFKTCTWLHFVC